MMRVFSRLAVLFCVATAAKTEISAAVTVYDNEPGFLSAATITSTTTFATNFSPANPIVIDGITYTAENAVSVFFRSLTTGFNNTEGMGSSNIELDTLTFGAGMEVGAIGFYIVPSVVPSAPFQGLAYDIKLTDRIGNTFTEILDFTTFTSDPAPESQYRGYTDPAGITEVTVGLNSGLSAFASNFAFDNVSRSGITPVPEPSGLVLMGIAALAGIAAAVLQRFARS